MKGKLVERQTIVTWHKPEEQMPPNDNFVIATVSGKVGHEIFDHAFMVANWIEGEGWYFVEVDSEKEMDEITVHAWCDLEPYRGESK